MKRGKKLIVNLVTALTLITAVQAVSPYAPIARRNVFSLQPAPPLPPPPKENVTLPKIFLNGVATITGRKQVLFQIVNSAKPGEPVREVSFVLSEGERTGDIEVLQIDEVSGTVRFKNHGEVQSLNLNHDGSKTGPQSPLREDASRVRQAGSTQSTLPIRKGETASAPAEKSMTPEMQTVLIEIERERNKNNPNYPPLPPTELTPKE